MAFKSKLNPDELQNMDQQVYVKAIQKETKRAAKFGQTGVVILSDFKFSCGNIGTMMILGKMTGPLAKFYKKQKKERKVEKDFAKGTCYFETKEGQTPTLHIAINDGKGKPAKMTKNGKRMFKKLGFVPNIFKGELPTLDESLTLDKGELAQVDEQSKVGNEHKALGIVAKQYISAFKVVANSIVPLLKMGDKATFNAKHFQAAKKAFVLSKSFQDKYGEAPEKRQEQFAEMKKKVDAKQDFLQKVAAKVKQMLMKGAQVHGGAAEVLKQLQEKKELIQAKIKKLNPELKKLLNLDS